MPVDQKKSSDLPKPRDQILELYDKVKATGIKEIKALNYPLGEEILNLFKSDSVDVFSRSEGLCDFESLTFESLAASKNPYSISYDKSNVKLFKQGIVFNPTDPSHNDDSSMAALQWSCSSVDGPLSHC